MKCITDIWQYRYYVISRLFGALSVLMLILELLNLIDFSDFIEIHKLHVFIVVVLISCIYSIFRILFPKKEIEIDINKRTKLTIKQGNIMWEDGVKVIPVNEYFDTHLGDGIISKNSLHGQLLSQYDGRITELRQIIDKQLESVEPLPENRIRTMVDGLPQKRYPLGTCVRIDDGKLRYLLVATTRFNKYEHVDVSAEEYPEIIRKMFNGIEQLQDGNPVYLPLVGSGISGYDLTNMQIMNVIVQTAEISNKLKVSKGLYLCIYSDEQMQSINLNIIKYLFKRWISLK